MSNDIARARRAGALIARAFQPWCALLHQREQVAVRISQECHPEIFRAEPGDEMRLAVLRDGDAARAQRIERSVEIFDFEVEHRAGWFLVGRFR